MGFCGPYDLTNSSAIASQFFHRYRRGNSSPAYFVVKHFSHFANNTIATVVLKNQYTVGTSPPYHFLFGDVALLRLPTSPLSLTPSMRIMSRIVVALLCNLAAVLFYRR